MSEIETFKHDEMNCVQDERLKAIEKRLDSIPNIEQLLKNIEIAVIGNNDLKITGIAERVTKHGIAIAWLQRIVYIGLGVGLGIGFVWTIYQGVK